jgi:hypothetical protein
VADLREAILARLAVVLGGVEGVKAVGRNVLDVPGIARPALILHDGSEEFFDKPDQERRSRAQRMELTPAIFVLVGADAVNVGSLLNTYRARVVPAVLGDAELSLLVNRNGEIRYHGCERHPATPESKEGRLELTFVFTYVFRPTDLV